MLMEREAAKRELREKIAGEITMSPEPGKTIRKWRETFDISQHDLSLHLNTSPSVISDYELGRRKSPGIATIRKIVDAFIEIDEIHGSKVLARYNLSYRLEAIISAAEFRQVVPAGKFVEVIEGKNVSEVSLDKSLHGYTIIDSMTAITTMSSFDYLKLYGWSSERALVFTGVKMGRSAMVAIRTHPLRPAMVVYTRPEKIDSLAVKLAELEDIPLIVTDLTPAKVSESLKHLEEGMY